MLPEHDKFSYRALIRNKAKTVESCMKRDTHNPRVFTGTNTFTFNEKLWIDRSTETSTRIHAGLKCNSVVLAV